MSVIGIEYIITGLVHVVHRAAVQSLAVEVAQSRQRRRSHGQDLAIRRSRVHAAVTQLAAAARHPTEIETEAPAMYLINPRENHVHGKC